MFALVTLGLRVMTAVSGCLAFFCIVRLAALGWDAAQLVGHLSSVLEALGSVPALHKPNMVVPAYSPSTRELATDG